METIFKEKIKKEPKVIDETYCNELDKEINLIPLYYEPVFTRLFSEKTFIKKFLILELDLNRELERQNAFYGESILFNNYGPFVVKTSIILKLDKKKLVFTFAKIDKKIDSNKLYVLSLNYKTKYNSKIKTNANFKRMVKNIKYYRKLYDDDIKLDKKSLLLVMLTSKNFKELYQILNKVFNKEETTNIIDKISKISQNGKIIKSWNKYQNSLLAKQYN